MYFYDFIPEKYAVYIAVDSYSPASVLQAFTAGAVISPLDLCECEPAIQPALFRAVGGILIAMDDNIAADVVKRYDV